MFDLSQFSLVKFFEAKQNKYSVFTATDTEPSTYVSYGVHFRYLRVILFHTLHYKQQESNEYRLQALHIDYNY